MKSEKTKLFVLLGLLVLAYLVGYILVGGLLSTPTPQPSPLPSPTRETPPLPTQLNRQGDTMISQTKEYNIVFQPAFGTHLIIIYGTPFATAREAAETEFLQKVGLTKEAACNLRVQISTPYFINPEEAEKTYGLSFCETASPTR